MIRRSTLAVFSSLLLLAACSSPRQVYEVTEVDRPPEFPTDSLQMERERARVQYVLPQRPARDLAPDRTYDLLHTDLALRPQFDALAVEGTVRHRLTPLRDNLAEFYFHAEVMDVERVAQVVDTTSYPVNFTADSTRLTVRPLRPLQRGEEYEFVVDYTAYPARGAGPGGLGEGGQGFYFIDPSGADPFRPTQLWTQGQSISNRRWFPTWDYPNDRMGFRIALTVPDSLVAFANGRLVEEREAGPGERTSVYVLDGNQPAYLAAVAAGPYTVVRDSVESVTGRTVPLLYAVEPAFADAAQRIFGETPRMLRYFEEYTGVPYAWPDYKQVPVRDFTAGGMENTTLTILFEHIQTDERGYLDYTGRDLIAHELVHHWFGDLLNAEDWGHLAVNESFASYFEELYLEEFFGRDAAQAHGIQDRDAYFEQAEALRRPIIWTGYEESGQMFDRHTYQKGGQVLNQLRFELGDGLFRQGIEHFLTKHAGQTVEIGDFREAMEEATGVNLRRFTDQWFEQPGHPVLAVEQAYFGGSQLYTLQVTQIQDLSKAPTYHFDVNVELNYPSGEKELRRVRIASADTTLRFRVTERPAFVRFDEGNWALADVRLDMPVEEALAMAVEDDEMAGRYDAVGYLIERGQLDPRVRRALLRVAEEDPHELVRERAVEGLGAYTQVEAVASALVRIAQDDPAPAVRRGALMALAAFEQPALLRPALDAALADPSYLTVATAVRLYAERFPEAAFDAFRPILDTQSWRDAVELALIRAIARHRLGGTEGAAYLVRQAGPINPDETRLDAIQGLLILARIRPDLRPVAAEALAALLDDARPAVRLAVVRGVGEVGTDALLERLQARLAVEPDAEIQAALRGAIEQVRKGETRVLDVDGR
ncbi:MAG: M1 family aminopeptidase, partial [Rhodothermales bacterium]|nr:M1 family aminopeptidase [Rhodothermales bacterium]